MADLLNHNITASGNVSATVPRFIIEALVVDSQDQDSIIADFTGANALVFPAVLATLTTAQRRAVLTALFRRIVAIKAGLDDGLQE